MSLVIDEVIAETAEPTAPRRPAGSEAAPRATRPPDLDRLEFQMRRRRHRVARLWAD